MWYEVKLTTQATKQIQNRAVYSHSISAENHRKWADTLHPNAKLVLCQYRYPLTEEEPLAYKRNTQNDFLRTFFVYYLIDEKKEVVCGYSGLWAENQIMTLVDKVSLNDTE